MYKTLILAVILCCFSSAQAQTPQQDQPQIPNQTCNETLEQIKQMKTGEDKKILELMNSLEQSGCIEQVGIKSFYWNRGNLKSNLKDYIGAYEDLSQLKSQETSPKDRATLLSQLGFIAMNLKQYDQAETNLVEALKIRPKLKKTLLLLATTRLFKEDKPGAVAAIEKLKAINPHDPELLVEVAKFYYDFKFMDNAIAVFKEYLNLKPDDHRALFAIGMAHISKKEHEKAFNWFIKSFESNPEYVVALNNAVAALLYDKKHDQAIETVLKHTIKRSEKDILRIRASVYEAAGWCGDAAHWYNEVAKLSSIKIAPQFRQKADDLIKTCSPEHQNEKDVQKYEAVP